MTDKDSVPMIGEAYRRLMQKSGPMDPSKLHGPASGPATVGGKRDEDDEDEEAMKKCKALALYRAQVKSRQIDPPFSLVQKEYEAVLRQVFATQAGDSVDDTRQTSSGVPHGPDETGIASSTKKPEKVGWVNQNQPTGSYRTTDPQTLPQPITSLPPSQIGRVGNNRYPEATHLTTAETGRGQTPGNTFDMPYGDKTPSGYSASGYNTELGSTQKVEKSHLGEYIASIYQVNEHGQEDHTGAMMLDELEKAAQAGRPGGAQAYREEDEDIHSAGPPERMDSDTLRAILDRAKAKDLAEAQKLHEVGDRLLEEVAREEAGDARLRPKSSHKREMAEKAYEQASDLMKRWNSGQYPSGSIAKKTTRHGVGW